MQARRHNLPSLTVKPSSNSDKLLEGPKSAPYLGASSSTNHLYPKSSTILLSNSKSSRNLLPKSEKTFIDNSYSFLPKLTQYQVSRTTRWDILGEEINKPDLSEENHDRNPRIKELLTEFLKYKVLLEAALEREKADLITSAFSIAESIFTLYKISISTITNPQVDSIIELAPLKSKQELLRGFLALVPEVCRFPYSFYTRIDLISLSFGGSLNIVKRSNRELLEKKLYNGVFPLGALPSDELIINHFYKTLSFHLRTVVPDFDERLTFNIKPSKSSAMLASTLGFLSYDSPRKKVDLNTIEEYGKLLKRLIRRPMGFGKSESEMVTLKGRALKEVLETVDSDGINDKFWSHLEYCDGSESNGFISQSKLPIRAL